MRVLVVVASNHGHTVKIAARLAAAIRECGLDAQVYDANQATPGPGGYDGVVVAGSLHGSSHQRELSDWVKANAQALAPLPSLLVSVSLTAAEDTAEAREATEGCIRTFVEDTGWTPGRAVPVAGALQYREYNVFLRFMIRRMMRRGGHPTDTSRDYDYTDWELVTRLAREFAATVGTRSPSGTTA